MNIINSYLLKKKSQASLEMLLIFGITFTVILILGGIFFNYSTGAKNTLDEKQLEKTGNELITNIEKIYFLGNNNMITFSANFPEGIDNFTIVHKNTTDGTTNFEYDYLNISYISDKEIIDTIFTSNENYIRFNCSKCYHTTNINGSYISYFNSSDFSGGAKRIKIQSKGDYIQLDFIKE